MSESRLEQITQKIRQCGLFLTWYDPGDNPRFRLSTRDGDYHGFLNSEIIGTYRTLGEVERAAEAYYAGWVRGFHEGKRRES